MKIHGLVQYVELDGNTYIVTSGNTGQVSVRVVTKTGPRLLTGSNASPALIARIMAKAEAVHRISELGNDPTCH